MHSISKAIVAPTRDVILFTSKGGDTSTISAPILIVKRSKYSVISSKAILLSIQYVDDVIVYKREETFHEYLKNYDIRFLGTDYRDGSYTGKDLNIDIIWLTRNHDYSSTKLKTDIYHSINGKVYYD